MKQEKQGKIIVLKKTSQKNLKEEKFEKTKDDLTHKEKIKQALIKKALGFNHNEIVEEYVVSEEGDVRLSKRKVTKKFVPPDIPAAKILLEELEEELDFENMTQEELEKEKQKLLKELKNL